MLGVSLLAGVKFKPVTLGKPTAEAKAVVPVTQEMMAVPGADSISIKSLASSMTLFINHPAVRAKLEKSYSEEQKAYLKDAELVCEGNPVVKSGFVIFYMDRILKTPDATVVPYPISHIGAFLKATILQNIPDSGFKIGRELQVAVSEMRQLKSNLLEHKAVPFLISPVAASVALTMRPTT